MPHLACCGNVVGQTLHWAKLRHKTSYGHSLQSDKVHPSPITYSNFLPQLWKPLSPFQWPSNLICRRANACRGSVREDSTVEVLEELGGFKEGEGVTILDRRESEYNASIIVVELARWADHNLAGARVLLLDRAYNIHSIYYRLKFWTDSYYDEVASLPPLLPEGPIAILGLGAGTAARILLGTYPPINLEGWELDPVVVDIARTHFDLNELENPHPATFTSLANFVSASTFHQASPAAISSKKGITIGRLTVHIGDALSGPAEDSFAGIFVDLFAKGAVIDELQEAATWQALVKCLKPGGRIMVNCGGAAVEPETGQSWDEILGNFGAKRAKETLIALEQVFPGEVLVKTCGLGGSIMALTGKKPDLSWWNDQVPAQMRPGLREWTEVDI